VQRQIAVKWFTGLTNQPIAEGLVIDDQQLWLPLRQGSVSDLIARRILELIAADRLRPGDRLPPERDLAAKLGTSRPSLREALRSLKAQGVVDIRHGSGVFVAEPAMTRSLRAALVAQEVSISELFDMREVLELPAAGWAARHRDEVRLAAVQQAFDDLMAASHQDEVDWERLRDLDAAFHLSIVRAAGNRFMTQTLGVLHEILSRGMETTLQVPGRLENSRDDHQRILDALLDGDATGARRAVAAHIQGARKAALARLKGSLAG
jgi:GntR family transcriptional repressor for pyruvate dehydrogenase complex